MPIEPDRINAEYEAMMSLREELFALARHSPIVAVHMYRWKSGESTSFESMLCEMVLHLHRQNQDLLKQLERALENSPNPNLKIAVKDGNWDDPSVWRSP